MQHSEYSDSSFWDKVKKFALTAGKEVIEKALWLYYAAQRPETPKWAKTAIYGARRISFRRLIRFPFFRRWSDSPMSWAHSPPPSP